MKIKLSQKIIQTNNKLPRSSDRKHNNFKKCLPTKIHWFKKLKLKFLERMTLEPASTMMAIMSLVLKFFLNLSTAILKRAMTILSLKMTWTWVMCKTIIIGLLLLLSKMITMKMKQRVNKPKNHKNWICSVLTWFCKIFKLNLIKSPCHGKSILGNIKTSSIIIDKDMH